MSRHELKVWPEFFGPLQSGDKPFEVRQEDDRTFDVGDVLVLREWFPAGEAIFGAATPFGVYSGRECLRRVTYVLRADPDLPALLPEGLVVLGLAVACDG